MNRTWPPLTPTPPPEFQRLYSLGLTDADIGRRLRPVCARQHVGWMRRKWGLAANRSYQVAGEGGRLAPFQEQRRIFSLMRDGATDQQIADALGCSRPAAAARRLRHGFRRVQPVPV